MAFSREDHTGQPGEPPAAGTPAPVKVTRPTALRPTTPPAALSTAPNAWTLLKALRKRWLMAATFGILFAAAAGVGTWFAVPPSKHTARTLMQVPPGRRFLMNTAEVTPDLANHQRTQVALVRSRLVLNAALKQPRVGELSIVREQVQAVEWLEKEVQADFSVAPEILRIQIVGDRPDELAPLINGIREAYRLEIIEKEKTDRVSRLTTVKELREHYEKKLKENKDEQRKLEAAAGSSNPGNRALIQAFERQHLGDVESSLLRTQAELKKCQVELKFAQESEAQLPKLSVPEHNVEDLFNKDPSVQQNLAEIQRLRGLMVATSERSALRDRDPSVLAAKNKLDAVQGALEAQRKTLRPKLEEQIREATRLELGRNVTTLQARIAVLQGTLELLQKEQKDLQDKAAKTTGKDLELNAVNEVVLPLEQIVKRLTDEQQALELEIKAAPERMRVLEDAVVTQTADMKRQIMMTGGAALAALALVALAIAYWEFRARRIDTTDEVVHGLGMRLVGALPDSNQSSAWGWFGFGPRQPFYGQNVLAESVDTTRTLLLQAAQGNNVRVVMITSANSGEGKTSLSTHLAASLAKVGYRTLLIDADLRNPTAHLLFELGHEPGLSEVLRGEVSPAEAVQATPVGNLWLLPAGRWDADAVRQLAQPGLADIFAGLRQQYDFILVDSSPVLPVTDPLLLGRQADGILLSLMRDVSRLPTVYAAYQRLMAAGLPMMGVVMNGVQGEAYGTLYPYAAQTVS